MVKRKQPQMEGDGIIQNIKQAVFGKTQLNGKSLKWFNANKNKNIVKIELVREPIMKSLKWFLNAATLGDLSKQLAERDYDDLYHLYVNIYLSDQVVSLQKDETILMGPKKKPGKEAEVRVINVNTGLTLGVAFQRTIKGYPSLKSAYSYNGSRNNCQLFIRTFLKKNPAIKHSSADISFVQQNIKQILDKYPRLNAFNRGVVDVFNRLSTLIGN